ncbi:MAG: hypothetical protein ACRDL7_14730, partial [Gaiellaceae bacterium]
MELVDVARVVTRTFIPKLSMLMKMELRRASADGDVSSQSVAGGAASEYMDVGDGDEEKGDGESDAAAARVRKDARKRAKKEEEYDDEVADEEDGVTGSRFGHRKEMASYGDMDDEERAVSREGSNNRGRGDATDHDDSPPSTYEIERTPSATVTDDEDVDGDMYDFSSNALKISKRQNCLILQPLRVDPAARALLMVAIVERAAEATIVSGRKGFDQAYLSDEAEDDWVRCLLTA